MFCNFSARELVTPGLQTAIAEALARYQLRPADLCLEITESHLADPRLEPVLVRLHRNGHPLAVDDFGTGYSSISRLVDLPVTYVKVDWSLVHRLPDHARSRALIDAIVIIARKLELKVICEGVETPAQVAYLTDVGVDLQQGYLHAMAQPASDITALLTRNQLASRS